MLLIKNGTIVDGTGNESFQSDILVEEGKIIKIAPNIPSAESYEVCDAQGYVVAPGIIDPHSHADLILISDDRQRTSAVCQGVTTEVVGLCGLGYIPLSNEQLHQTLNYSRSFFGNKKAYEAYDLSSFESYMRLIDGAGINIAVSATHNGARIATTGFERKPDIRKLCNILRGAMEAGCVGISTGLSYYPCAYADFPELIAIAEVLKEYDGLFLSHIRYPQPDAPYGALREFMDLGKTTGARIHILHYRTKYPLDAGKPEILLNMIREANAAGADITLETCPYISGSTTIQTVLPGWVMEGGYDAAQQRLQDPALRPRIADEIQRLVKMTVMGNGKPARFGHVGGQHPEYSGRIIEDVMRERGQSMEEFLIDMLIEAKLDVNYVGTEAGEDPAVAKMLYDDIMTLLMDPLYLVGSDSMMYGEYLHPRSYGCYAKMMRLSRAYGIPIEQIIKKLTADPAHRLRLYDRGELKEGKAADIIVFKPDEVLDRSTFENSAIPAAGMQYVFVNGVKAVENGLPTGSLAGQALKKG